MENARTRNRGLETVAWGAFFVWWGVPELVQAVPDGTGAIGIGLILVGLNVARSLNGVATSGFTTVAGVIALALGGLEFVVAVLALPFEVPVFAILLIVFGVVLVGRQL